MESNYLQTLIELFEQSTLTEMQIAEEGTSITFKRSAEPQSAANPRERLQVQEETAVDRDEGTVTIPSPIIGTFYRTPAPDAPPFAEVGDRISTGGALGIIEAMKMMNRLEAEYACEIVAFHAEHGQLVEYGAPLIEVRPL